MVTENSRLVIQRPNPRAGQERCQESHYRNIFRENPAGDDTEGRRRCQTRGAGRGVSRAANRRLYNTRVFSVTTGFWTGSGFWKVHPTRKYYGEDHQLQSVGVEVEVLNSPEIVLSSPNLNLLKYP